MAEEEKELDLDVEEEAKPKSKLIIIIVVVVLLLGGIGAAVMLLMGGDDEEESSSEEVPAEELEVKTPAIYIPMKPSFIVNFATPGAQRFLQVEVNLMTRNPAVVNVVEQHIPLIRNNFIALFSAQEFEEVATTEGKEALRQAALEEIQNIINDEMGEPGIEQVLFTAFVIQ